MFGIGEREGYRAMQLRRLRCRCFRGCGVGDGGGMAESVAQSGCAGSRKQTGRLARIAVSPRVGRRAHVRRQLCADGRPEPGVGAESPDGGPMSSASKAKKGSASSTATMAERVAL